MSNLKPFDLERALAGDPVITRSGAKVLDIYHFNKSTASRPVVVTIEGLHGEFALRKEGVRWDDGKEDDNDLFMAPKIVTYYCASWRRRGAKGSIHRQWTDFYISLEDIEMHAKHYGWEENEDFQIHEINVEE